MATDRPNGSLSPAEPFFTTLFRHDAAGGSWLSALAAVPAASGRLGCFEYPAAATKRLLAWYIDHPDQLVWPTGAGAHASAGR